MAHHHHGPLRAGEARRLLFALVLALVAMLAEGIGGWIAHSLALLSDAGHMLADAAAIALSLFAVRVGARPADARRIHWTTVAIIALLALFGTIRPGA